MAQVNVKNQLNEVVGTTNISDSIINEDVRRTLIHEVVLKQLADRRAGTHSTKTRSFVSGGGRKPWKQKGTGRARSGSTRSPLWRGGGVIFGPEPRDYSYTMPKKKVALALKSIVSAKYSQNRISIIDRFDVSSGKTKDAAKILKTFEADRSVLFILNNPDEKVVQAFRNIACVKLLHVNGLNVYDLVNARKIFITKDALSVIETRLGGEK